MTRMGQAKVICHFFIDVLQRWRWGNAVAYGKAKAMRLSCPMIGVLAKDDDLHLIEWRHVKSDKDFAASWIYVFSSGFFSAQKLA